MATKASKRIADFLGEVAADQYVPQQRFLRDAVKGIIVSRSTVLSSWSKALIRRGKDHFHTTKRLSNNLKSDCLNDDRLRSASLGMSASMVRDHCEAVSVDLTDIAKKFGRKMPLLDDVHDGSEKKKKKKGEKSLARGWMVLRCDGVGKNGRHVPLHIETFSRVDPGYRGDGKILKSCLATIRKEVPASMQFVFDSGNDGVNYRRMFHGLELLFTVRLKCGHTMGKRRLEVAGRETTVRELQAMRRPHRFRIRWNTTAAHHEYATLGWCNKVHFVDSKGLPESKRYSIVVVHGHSPGENPMVILTTDHVQTDEQARKVAQRYLNRWAIEEGHRLLKTQFGLEDLRVLTWVGIQRMVFLVHLVFTYMCWLVYRCDGEQLAEDAPGFGAVPTFLYYRIADGEQFLLIREG